jgi:hypothetical protein
MTTRNEFVEFWLDVSVQADEQEGQRRDEAAGRQLADNLLRAAHEQGFSKEEIEAELGSDVEAYIRGHIDRSSERC